MLEILQQKDQSFHDLLHTLEIPKVFPKKLKILTHVKYRVP